MPALQCTKVNFPITSFQSYKNKSILMPTLPKVSTTTELTYTKINQKKFFSFKHKALNL